MNSIQIPGTCFFKSIITMVLLCLPLFDKCLFSLPACCAVISAVCATHLVQSQFVLIIKVTVLDWLLFICLFLAWKPRSGPGLPHSRIF